MARKTEANDKVQARPGSNLSVVKKLNRSVVFEAIRLNAPISRVELARATRLTPTTITNIVGEFLKEGLITERPALESRVGRRPALLEINPTARYVVGVDLARTKITCGVFDLSIRLLSRSSVDAGLSDPSSITLRSLVDTISEAIASRGIDTKKLLGIGVSAPGPLDPMKGILGDPPNFPGWAGVPLRELLEPEFGVPVFLENDANACALAEKWFGAAKLAENFVYLAIGTGVGAGIFVDGKLCEGSRNLAGEIGHTTVDINGPRCGCGNYGCLELYVSVPAVFRRLREVAEEIWSNLSGGLAVAGEPGDGVLAYPTLADVAKAAQRGDEVSRRVVQEVGRILGVGVTNIVNSFNPEMVVLGRELPNAWGGMLLEKVQEVVRQRALLAASRTCEIRISELGNEPAVIGGATLVLREFFKDPVGFPGAEFLSRVGGS